MIEKLRRVQTIDPNVVVRLLVQDAWAPVGGGPVQAPELTPHQTGARRDYCGRDVSIDPAMQ
jgi:hypothetical protein